MPLYRPSQYISNATSERRTTTPATFAAFFQKSLPIGWIALRERTLVPATNLIEEGASRGDVVFALAEHDIDSDQEGVDRHFAFAEQPIHYGRDRAAELFGQRSLAARDQAGLDERSLVCGARSHGSSRAP